MAVLVFLHAYKPTMLLKQRRKKTLVIGLNVIKMG